MLANGFQVFYWFSQQLLQVDHFASAKVEKRLEAIAEAAALGAQGRDGAADAVRPVHQAIC